MKPEKRLDNIKLMERVDSHGMCSRILGLSDQIADALDIAKGIRLPKRLKGNISEVIFSGVGGSAIGADLLKSYLARDLGLPLLVNRDYEIPAFTGNSTLFFALSYSGNTEETVTAYKRAKKRGAKIVAISSGGKLEALAGKDAIFHIKIPQGYPPRAAISFLTIAALGVLRRMALISDRSQDIRETADVFKKMALLMGPSVPFSSNEAKRAAAEINGRFPFLYGAESLASVVTRWRCQFAENSKILSSSNVLPEMNHNEIEGWESFRKSKDSFIALFLRCRCEGERVARRLDITKDLLSGRGVKTVEFTARGRGRLSGLFSLVFTGDIISFYLAVLRGVDPTPIDTITLLKDKLVKEKT